MSADNTQETSQIEQTDSSSEKSGTSIDLTELKAQLAELAENQKVSMEALSTLARSQRQPEPEMSDDDLYDPKKLLKRTEQSIDQKLDQRLQLETAKNLKIAEMSKEYPEINSDAKLISSITQELSKLPRVIQGTPDGYEVAILKAVSKAGITPRSRRSSSLDSDVSMGGSGASRGPSKKSKATAEQLELASLLGMNVDDPKYVERLEKTINKRSDYKKWE